MVLTRAQQRRLEGDRSTPSEMAGGRQGLDEGREEHAPLADSYKALGTAGVKAVQRRWAAAGARLQLVLLAACVFLAVATTGSAALGLLRLGSSS